MSETTYAVADSRILDCPVTPSQELVLLCMRARWTQSEQAQLQALGARISDWDAVWQMTEAHGMSALLAHRLRADRSVPLPAVFRSHLEQFAVSQKYRSLMQSAELVGIVSSFEAAGIPTLAIKGPTLAVLAYKEIWLRRFGDLDVVVPAEHLAEAWQLLEARGYHVNDNVTLAQIHTVLDSENNCGFVQPESHFKVELHWHLIQMYFGLALDEKGIWERRIPVRLTGHAVQTCGANDLFLFLCVHGAKHLWNRLCWVADIAWLAERAELLDWEWLENEAARHGVRRVLLLGCLMGHALAGANVPEPILRAARADKDLNRLSSELLGRALASVGAPTERMAWAGYFLRLQDGMVAKGRTLFRFSTAIKYSDAKLADLPPSLTSLYLGLRVLRLGEKLLRRSF